MTQANYNQKADKFHIIGHSIGAHAAGDAGSRTAGLARITGKSAAASTLHKDLLADALSSDLKVQCVGFRPIS